MLNESLARQDKLLERCERNMQKLEEAFRVIRGVEVQVRPHAKKSGWYGEELDGNSMERFQPNKINQITVELDSKSGKSN